MGNELCEYAGDTYVIIAAASERSHSSELDHMPHWTKSNNLMLNCHKS